MYPLIHTDDSWNIVTYRQPVAIIRIWHDKSYQQTQQQLFAYKLKIRQNNILNRKLQVRGLATHETKFNLQVLTWGNGCTKLILQLCLCFWICHLIKDVSFSIFRGVFLFVCYFTFTRLKSKWKTSVFYICSRSSTSFYYIKNIKPGVTKIGIPWTEFIKINNVRILLRLVVMATIIIIS